MGGGALTLALKPNSWKLKAYDTVEEFGPSLEDQSVEPNGKLTITWGTVKTNSGRTIR